MLIQDQFGYFHDVPGERFAGWVSPRFGEVYGGLGNPLGFPALAALLPFAAKLLPMAANLLPMLAPSGPSAPSPSAPPPGAGITPASPVAPFPPTPSMSPPQIIVVREPAPERGAFLPPPQIAPRVLFRRRGARRRRTPIRARVERFTEQVSVPPSALPEPVSMATEASGEMNGWYSGPYFGGYY
jgi:hypothetical protein